VIKALCQIVMVGLCSFLGFSVSGAILSSPDYAELKNAVQAGGYVRLDFDGTVSFPAEISVSKDVEIDGSGRNITFDGRSMNRLFSVSAAHLKLRTLALANGAIWGVAGTNDGYGPE
jgi:hypothetical protein